MNQTSRQCPSVESQGRRVMFANTPVITCWTGEEVDRLRVALIVIGVVLSLLASAGFCAWSAHVKGRVVGTWLSLGLVFGPFALLAIAGAPAVVSPEARWSSVAPARRRRRRAFQDQAGPEASSLAAVQAGGVQRAGVRGRHEAAQTSPEHQELLDASRARRETLEQRRTRFDD